MSRLRRALMRLQDQSRRMRHLLIREQVDCLNQMLRGHDAYYGIAGNIRALQRVHRPVERYWRKTLSSRSWHGQIWWKKFQHRCGEADQEVFRTQADDRAGPGRSIELVLPARRSGGSAAGTESGHDSESDARGVRKHAALPRRLGKRGCTRPG
jgi:hypothetical protein